MVSETVRSQGWRSPSAHGRVYSVFRTPLPASRHAPDDLGHLSGDFEQPGSTHARTNTHGNHNVFNATTFAFDQGMANQT